MRIFETEERRYLKFLKSLENRQMHLSRKYLEKIIQETNKKTFDRNKIRNRWGLIKIVTGVTRKILKHMSQNLCFAIMQKLTINN